MRSGFDIPRCAELRSPVRLCGAGEHPIWSAASAVALLSMSRRVAVTFTEIILDQSSTESPLHRWRGEQDAPLPKLPLAPIAAALAFGLATSLTGCAGEEPAKTEAPNLPVEPTVTAQSAAQSIEFTDGVVRAKDADDDRDDDDRDHDDRGDDRDDDDRMSAIYGTLHNRSDQDVTITAFTTSLGDADYEVHEIANGTMRTKDGGLTIPAGGSLEMTPGGVHLMILGYGPAIAEGSTVNITLSVTDGDAVTIKDVPVREVPDDDANDPDDERGDDKDDEVHETENA